MDIQYAIKFYSLWHCGSGETKGGDLDALVLKDQNQIPYIPGKTLKGLLLDAVNDLKDCGKAIDKDALLSIFGSQPDIETDRLVKAGEAAKSFFSNAKLSDALYANVKNTGTHHYLYRKISSTRIGDNGAAEDNSLRAFEMTVPMTLYATIQNVTSDQKELLVEAMKMVKRMGVGRNRGYGRCLFSIQEEVKP